MKIQMLKLYYWVLCHCTAALYVCMFVYILCVYTYMSKAFVFIVFVGGGHCNPSNLDLSRDGRGTKRTDEGERMGVAVVGQWLDCSEGVDGDVHNF